MDIALALLPSVFYGFTSIIIMLLGGDPRQQSMGQILGGFVVALITLPFAQSSLSWQDALAALVAGMALGIGLNLQVRTFHIIGVGRTMPIASGGQILGISLVGIVAFGEWRGPGALPVGLAGLALVILGVAATSWTQKSRKGTVTWHGTIHLLVISITGLCTYVLMLRIFDVDPIGAFLPVSVGAFISVFILTFPRFSPQFGPKDTRWSKYTLRQMLSGLVWGTGTVAMQYSTAHVGVATGFTLSQLGVAISTFGAVWLLGEHRTRKEWWVMALGVALLLTGTIMVGAAKSLDV